MHKKASISTRFFTSTKAKRSVKPVSTFQPFAQVLRMPHMRVVVSVVLLCVVFPSGAAAQNILKRLNKGVEAHKRYDLITCDTVLSRVLEKKELLNKAQLGEAIYFFNRNLFRLTVDEAEGSLGYNNLPTQLKFYRAYNNYLELERLNISRWSAKARPEIELMFPALLSASVKCLDIYVDQGEKRSVELQGLILGYIGLASSILPENYTPTELKGQLYYINGDLERAAQYFDESLKKYRARRVLMLDNIRMPNVYFQRSLIWLNQGNLEKAYRLAREGYMRNEVEWKTLGVNQTKFEPKAVKEQEPLYFNNQYNLGLLELELIVQLYPESDSTFLLYQEREPYYKDVFSYHYNYAGLMEKVNPRTASMHYQAAIDIDSTSFEAYFQMAKLYIDMGFTYIDGNPGKDEEAKQLRLQGKQMLEIGLPYLQQASSLQPNSVVSIAVLVEVCKELGLQAEAAQYKSILDSLQKP